MHLKVLCDIKDRNLIDLYEKLSSGTCCARMMALVLHFHTDQSTSGLINLPADVMTGTPQQKIRLKFSI